MRTNFYQNSGPRPPFNPQIPNRPSYQYNNVQSPNQNSSHQGQLSVEPMDIDRSIQTGRVNYMNRPPINQFPKRPAGTSFQGPVNKIQRNFHMETLTEDPQNNWDNYPIEGYEADGTRNGEADTIGEYYQKIPEVFATEDNTENQLDYVQDAVNFLD